MARRRGRPAKYVVGRDGRPVVGLSQEIKSGRYYATHTRPRVYFGRDFDAAMLEFRRWEAEQNGRTLIPIAVPTAKGEKVRLVEPLAPALPDGPIPKSKIGTVETQAFQLMDESALYDWARAQILSDPKRFAQQVGIEQLSYLEKLKPPAPSITLEALGNLYLRKRDLSAEWKQRAGVFWQEFREIVKVQTVREISAEHVEAYDTAVFAAMDRDKRSPVFVRHRFAMIKTIMNHGLRRGKDQAEIRRVLDLCKMLIPPKPNGKNPQPISREHFHALLSVCDAKWKAVFLLSLNAALHASEVAAVKKSEIDLDAKTLCMNRGKTGILRVAVLWSRTVEAVRDYQRECPHDSDYLFVSKTGQQYARRHVTRNFRRRRKLAGVPETVAFEHLRDSALTAAIGGGADLMQARLLAGHSAGVSDFYAKRSPQMVKGACEAIEQFYFGDE